MKSLTKLEGFGCAIGVPDCCRSTTTHVQVCLLILHCLSLLFQGVCQGPSPGCHCLPAGEEWRYHGSFQAYLGGLKIHSSSVSKSFFVVSYSSQYHYNLILVCLERGIMSSRHWVLRWRQSVRSTIMQAFLIKVSNSLFCATIDHDSVSYPLHSEVMVRVERVEGILQALLQFCQRNSSRLEEKARQVCVPPFSTNGLITKSLSPYQLGRLHTVVTEF